MTRFYIGCRIDEIVNICPNEGGTKYKTTVHFKNGSSVQLTGDWDVNVEKVERIMRENDSEQEASRARVRQIERDVRELESRRNELTTQIALAEAKVEERFAVLAEILAPVLMEEKTYITAEHRRRLREMLLPAKGVKP